MDETFCPRTLSREGMGSHQAKKLNKNSNKISELFDLILFAGLDNCF